MMDWPSLWIFRTKPAACAECQVETSSSAHWRGRDVNLCDAHLDYDMAFKHIGALIASFWGSHATAR